MQTDQALREELIKHLKGGTAFYPLDKFIDDIPYEKTGVIVGELPYSLWQQFYHLKFTQKDILDFSRNADYQEANWPDDYWPESKAPANEKEWKDTVAAYFDEREAFIALIRDKENDLYEPFAHGSGQHLLNEALLIIQHTAYHSGQMLIIMRQLGLH